MAGLSNLPATMTTADIDDEVLDLASPFRRDIGETLDQYSDFQVRSGLRAWQQPACGVVIERSECHSAAESVTIWNGSSRECCDSIACVDDPGRKAKGPQELQRLIYEAGRGRRELVALMR